MRRLSLTQGRVALVDDADYDAVCAVGRWQVGSCGGRLYAQHATSGGVLRLHTFLTGWQLVDHINGDGLDNRRANVRLATSSQNGANKAAPRSNTSGFKGVSLYRRTGRGRAYITVLGVETHLGYFATAEDAAFAYDAAAQRLFGEFARLNFPTTPQEAA